MPLESSLTNFHFEEHNAVLCSSSAALYQLLIEYARFSLKSSNEILLILTSADSTENLLSALKDIDSDKVAKKMVHSLSESLLKHISI